MVYRVFDTFISFQSILPFKIIIATVQRIIFLSVLQCPECTCKSFLIIAYTRYNYIDHDAGRTTKHCK